MRLALLFCLSLVSLSIFAQDSLSFDTPLVESTIDPTLSDVEAHARVYNNGPRRLQLRWIREVNSLPAGWNSAVCDTNQCYLPQVDSADFVITPNGSAPIIPHVYPDGTPGDAQLTIRVLEIANRSNNAVATFRFAGSTSNSVRNPYYAGPRIFPNPGQTEFEVSSNVTLSQVTITNLLGKLVRTYPGSMTRFDVRDLPNGIYLVSLVGTDGRIVKTLRYSKRNGMP